MQQCPTFDNLSTGFEDIEYFRRETQIAATSIIATTIVVSQIWILLLFLPLTQLPKCMRKLDIELNFEEIFAKKKKTSKIQSESETETESLLADEREQSKRRKRASGGVATMIIVVILIIVSTTSFVVTSESPGTVSYQTNQLSEIYNVLDKSTTSLGLLFDFAMTSRVINTYVVYSNPKQYIENRTCDMKRIKLDNSYGRAQFVLNADKFDTHEYNPASGFQIYATVCKALEPHAKAFSISAYTPVRSTLSSYPPPGIFTDGPTVIKSGEVATSTTVPIVSLTWTWTEMVSTSILDLLAPLSTSRKLQAKVSSTFGTRGINSTFTYIDGTGRSTEYPWPTCDKLKNEPVLSFILSYQPDSPNNESYVVSERSFLSWAFATLITLGSVIALKPTITNYLDKLSNYWRMKLWARWTLFVLYTLLMPLPMLLVLFKFITQQDRLQVRGANFSYYMTMMALLIAMAALLMLTWVGVLARHIYMTRQESIKKKREREEQVNVIVEPQVIVDAGYEEIKFTCSPSINLKIILSCSRSRTNYQFYYGKFPLYFTTYTPVSPKLSSYPPPGIFVDRNAVIKNAGVATSATVPVVSLRWTWTEMVSTSILELLEFFTTSRTLQAKVSSTLALSFIIAYQYDSPDNESYVVSDRSFLSWAFATLITLGSVIALKPTITNYLDKLSNYWRMKLWARWTLFVLYTLLMPLPMLLIVLQSVSNANSTYIPVRGVERSGLSFVLLATMASFMVVTWLGVVVRHINVTQLDCIKKRKEKEEQVVIIENGPDVVYEEIK